MCTIARIEKDFLYISKKGAALPARKGLRTQWEDKMFIFRGAPHIY